MKFSWIVPLLTCLGLSACGVPTFEEKCEKALPPFKLTFDLPPFIENEKVDMTADEIQTLTNTSSPTPTYQTIKAAGTYTMLLNAIQKKFHPLVCVRPELTISIPIAITTYVDKSLVTSPCRYSLIKEYNGIKISELKEIVAKTEADLTVSLNEKYQNRIIYAESVPEAYAKLGLELQGDVTAKLFALNKDLQEKLATKDETWDAIVANIQACSN